MGSKGGGSVSEVTVEPTDMTPVGEGLKEAWKNYDQQTEGVEGSYYNKSGDEDIFKSMNQISLPESTIELAKELSEAYMNCIKNSNFCQLARDLRDEVKKNLEKNKKIKVDLKPELNKIFDGLELTANEEFTKYLRQISCAMGTSRTSYFMASLQKYQEELATKLLKQMGELTIAVTELEINSIFKSLDQLYDAYIRTFTDMGNVSAQFLQVIKGAEIAQSDSTNRDYSEKGYDLKGYYQHLARSQDEGEIPPDNGLLSNLAALVTAPIIG